MNYLKLAFVCVVLMGCHRKHNQPEGMVGLNTPQEIKLEGSVSSDIIIVIDPRIALGSDFNGVVVGDTIITMPYFLNAYGTNVYFHVEPTVNRVIIFNAQKAKATSYILKFDI